MSGRVAIAAAGALYVLCGCEDNEHPFGDSWAVSCAAEEAPSMTAWFLDPRRLDDAGNRREYLGRVEVGGTEVTDVWLWQVEVDLRDDSATTVAFEHVPLPQEYVALEGFRPLDFAVDTFVEAPDTASATMTGECRWGDGRGDLALYQNDDCDLCFDCSTGPRAPAGAVAPLAALLLWRRRRSGR